MARNHQPALVTGISPSLGPPGTKVTIRGENLGLNESDLQRVIIGVVDCTMMSQWHSSKRITAIASGKMEGEQSIIVITASGGRGSSTVKFNMQFPAVGPHEDVGYWPHDERQVGPAICETTKNVARLPESMNANPLNVRTRALSEGVLLSMYPQGVGYTADLNSDRFDPKLYLLKYHKNTTYSELKGGLTRMQTEMTHKAEEPISLMRANLPAVFQGLQNVLDLQKLMSADLESLAKSDSNASGPFVVSDTLNQCLKISENIFNSVLKRKDRADATRTTLGLLQRFKFLFHLPASIRENIRLQRYNLVINDYLRAKALFSDTEVQTFREVYAQVESIIDSFKDLLKARLLRMPSGFEESKECIRYLTQLGVPYDPAWECLKGQSEWFLDQFNRLCSGDKSDTPTSGPQTDTSSTNTPTSELGVRAHSGKASSAGGNTLSPPSVLYIEALCKLMREHFPDYWRLGSATVGSTGEERRAEWLSSVHSVVKSFLGKISLSSGYQQKQDEKMDVVPPQWLPHCAKVFRRCQQDLSTLKDLPIDILRPCQDLLQGLRVHTTMSLLYKTEKEISQLEAREAWITEIGGEGKEGATTQLPILYENLVNEMLSMLQDIVIPQTPSEKEIFANETTRDGLKVSKLSVQKSCIRLMNAFPVCLRTMASKTDSEKVYRHRSETSISVDSNQSLGGHMLTHSRAGKLIVLVNNCRWTRTHLNSLLLDGMAKLGFPNLNRVQTETNSFYESTQKDLLCEYVELKAGCVFGPIEMQMGSGEECGWKGVDEVSGVRHYMKSLIHACGAVHSELLLVSPSGAQSCLQTVLIRVLEELRRCYQGLKASKEWDRMGRLQAQLDLRLLERAFAEALSKDDEAKSLLNCVITEVSEGAVPSPDENKHLDNLCNVEVRRMHYLIVGLVA